MINVTGVLVDPMNIPSAKATIRVEALNTEGTLAHSLAETKTGADGSYNFQLLEGHLAITVLYSDEYTIVGEIDVTAAMSGTTYTLPVLLDVAKWVEPEPVPET